MRQVNEWMVGSVRLSFPTIQYLTADAVFNPFGPLNDTVSFDGGSYFLLSDSYTPKNRPLQHSILKSPIPWCTFIYFCCFSSLIPQCPGEIRTDIY